MRRRSDWLIPISLCATAAVPWTAFLDGHPFRIRYMVPLIAFQAVILGALAGLAAVAVRRYRPAFRQAEVAAAVLVAGVTAFTLNPLDGLDGRWVPRTHGWRSISAGGRKTVRCRGARAHARSPAKSGAERSATPTCSMPWQAHSTTAQKTRARMPWSATSFPRCWHRGRYHVDAQADAHR